MYDLIYEKNSRFQVKEGEEEDKGKRRKIRKEIFFFFLLYFEKLVFCLQKRLIQKGRHLVKIDMCQHKEETKFLTENDS